MSYLYGRANAAPKTTGLEEFTAARGTSSQRIETIQDADELIVGEASSSIPNATAYEILCGVNHVREAAGRVRTFVFPTAPIHECTTGTDMKPTMFQHQINEHKTRAEDSNQLVINPDQVEKGAVGFGTNPLARVTNMVTRAIGKQYENGERNKIQAQATELGITEEQDVPRELAKLALTDSRVAELLPPVIRERIQTYLLKLPSNLYQTTNGVAFVEHIVRQRLKATLELGELLLEGKDRSKLDNFSIESIVEHLGDLNLAQIGQILGPEQAKKIAFTYNCAECGINTPKKVAHYVLFDGTLLQKNGQKSKKTKKNPLVGCKMLGDRLDTAFSRQSLLETPVKDLIQAGFMLSGTGIYGALQHVFDNGKRTLGVANYKPARGTVKALSKMWKGPMYITTRARIYKENRIASYPELQEYLQSGDQAVGKFMDFARSIPILAEGNEMKFKIE